MKTKSMFFALCACAFAMTSCEQADVLSERTSSAQTNLAVSVPSIF